MHQRNVLLSIIDRMHKRNSNIKLHIGFCQTGIVVQDPAIISPRIGTVHRSRHGFQIEQDQICIRQYRCEAIPRHIRCCIDRNMIARCLDRRYDPCELRGLQQRFSSRDSQASKIREYSSVLL